MNKHIAKLITLGMKDKHERWLKRERLISGIKDHTKIKLFMTLVVKNEENIIEQNIRYHKAMGVDGFIVVNHNSIDKTQEILEKLQKENLVKEILIKNDIKHQHNKWVHEMIKLAKRKYKADWIINADADEFYFSKDWNLKFSICQYPKVNVFKLNSNFVFPNDEYDLLLNPYFTKNPIKDNELEDLKNKYPNLKPENFTLEIARNCPKVIHKSKGYVKIAKGNHDVEMRNKIIAQSSDIVLYHYHIPNYKSYEQKALRWMESAKYLTKGDNYLTDIIKLYKENKLEDFYKENYTNNKEMLLNEGIIAIDNSIVNFVKSKGLI